MPDDFFVGYGFDYHQSFRNLPYVAYLNTRRARRGAVLTAGMPAAAIRLHSAGADAAPIVLAATLYLPDLGAGPGGAAAPRPASAAVAALSPAWW